MSKAVKVESVDEKGLCSGLVNVAIPEKDDDPKDSQDLLALELIKVIILS